MRAFWSRTTPRTARSSGASWRPRTSARCAGSSFGDADAAWEACRREVFPLAVVDLQLPGGDGLWLARRIRELPHGDVTTILMVVGQAARDDLSQILAAGADDYATEVDPGLFGVRLAIAEARAELAASAHQQGAATAPCWCALAAPDVEAVLAEAIRTVVETLHVDHASITELLPDGRALVLRAGFGADVGEAGRRTSRTRADLDSGLM